MKLNKLSVIVSNKKGDYYEVCLTEQDRRQVRLLISKLHGGVFKILKPSLGLY